MRDTIEKRVVMDALSMGLGQGGMERTVLHRSDQGSHHASHDCQEMLSKAGITGSMGRKGDCRDNAVVESFFSPQKSRRLFRL